MRFYIFIIKALCILFFFNSCNRFYRPLRPIYAYAGQKIIEKEYKIRPIFLENYVFQIYDYNNKKLSTSREKWLIADSCFVVLEKSLKNIGLEIEVSSFNRNLYRPDAFPSAKNHPKEIQDKDIIELAKGEKGRLKMLPVISVIKYISDEEFSDDISSPSYRHYSDIYLSIYLVEGNHIRYFRSGFYQNFHIDEEGYKDDDALYDQSTWNQLSRKIMKNYISRIK